MELATLEIIVLFGFGLVSYLLWEIRQQLFFIKLNQVDYAKYIIDKDRSGK